MSCSWPSGDNLPKYTPTLTLVHSYFLFAASLIILSNEFAAIYPNPSYAASISNTIAIMRYCAESDPQANRLLFILTSFRNVIYELRQKKPEQPAMPAPQTLSPTALHEPISTIFKPTTLSRKNSFATGTSGPPVGAVKTMAPPPLSMKTDYCYSTPAGPSAGVSPAGSTPGMSQGDQSTRMGGDSDTGDGELEFDQIWGWSAVPGAAGGPIPAGVVTPGPSPAAVVAGTAPNAPGYPTRGPGPRFPVYANYIVPGGPNGAGVPAIGPGGYVAPHNMPMYVPAEYS